MATAVRNALLSFCFARLIGGGRGQGESSLTADPPSCFGAGSIAAAVLLTFLATLLLIGGLLYFLKRRGDARKGNHLILETDPERGEKAEYAFDNPGFKDATLPAATKPDTSNKTKWTHWSSLVALHLKPDKKRAFDDSALQSHEVKVVALKSQDFTGLGFNICGNMKEGIYIKDILHRGPAFESGKLHPGDRISSVTISFEHMVYEDALNILSYASPYEVIVEAKSGRIISFQQGQDQSPVHPIFRSVSSFELTHPKKKLFGDDHSTSSNYSSLQKSRSNVTTLERKESKSPRPNQPKPKKDNKPSPQTPEMLLKSHLDETIAEESLRIEAQPQRSLKASPKVLEQNQNNASIDEVDVIKVRPPQAKKREKKSPEPVTFQRNDSGIRRDLNGIPLEIPEHMQDVALMAKRNRKSCTENGLEDPAKRAKGKAPSPPAELKTNFTLGGVKSRAFEDLSALGTDSEDDEDEANQMSSVNTIELNSSDVTVHQAQEEERKSRKTASTGDLTKMKRAPKSNSGTLERAQSLDITDTSGPGLSKMRAYDATENLLIDREPRLSLILDGLNTFQRNRLKTSAEWGNLEDAILNVSDEDFGERRKSEPQFNAVMDKVIQIKRESGEIEVLPDELVRKYQINDVNVAPQVMNKLWPDDEEIDATKQTVPPVPERTKLKLSPEQLPQPTERVSKIDVVLENNSAIPSLLNRPDSSLQVEYECLKPIPPKRERTPDNETVINLNDKFNKVPMVTTFEKNNVSEMCSQMAKDRNGNLDAQLIKDEWEVDQLHNTSPPPSMTLVDEVMDSYNKNYGGTVTVVQTEPTCNVPDETLLKHLTANFIYNERTSDTNVPDDVKVSRSSFDPQGGSSNLHSLELSINNELYTTALEHNDDVTVIVSSPSSVTVRNTNTPEVEITESTFSKIAPPNEQSDYKVEITESKYTTIEVQEPPATSDIVTYKGIEDESPAISLTDVPEYEKKTYITEIQVMTPASGQNTNTDDPLENAFENYVKNFERKLETFESNMQNFENNLEEFIRDEPTSIVLQEDVEKQASKIQEIAEEQLKTLPEMRFSTSSYESGGRKTPEKRHSFELLRSSFEKASSDKSPQRRDSKSRIPIATTMKTPPTSPERRDSRNLDTEPDKAILELMSSSKIKSPGATKNVSVTSIRNNSKLPSGLPTLSARPPIPPRKSDEVSANGGTESSFKQWVFNPNVTNVTVGKEK